MSDEAQVRLREQISMVVTQALAGEAPCSAAELAQAIRWYNDQYGKQSGGKEGSEFLKMIRQISEGNDEEPGSGEPTGPDAT